MKQYVLTGVTLAIVLVGGMYYSQMSKGQDVPTASVETSDEAIAPAAQDAVLTDAEVGLEAEIIREFTVVGNNFSFDTDEIVVDQGDTVRIVFQNQEGFHDWVLDEFSARTPVITIGQEAVVEFVADQVGEFEYYCSVGDHRAQGMRGTLRVE